MSNIFISSDRATFNSNVGCLVQPGMGDDLHLSAMTLAIGRGHTGTFCPKASKCTRMTQGVGTLWIVDLRLPPPSGNMGNQRFMGPSVGE